MADLPDWTRAVLLQGHDAAGNVVTILVGDDGQLYALLAAQDGTGAVHVVKCDTSGQLVIVPRGAEGNYLSVSADGFLTAVLKGQRDGVLTTIGVDDEGRIEAFMLDDESQWGDVIKVGNAEMAVRLGSPVCFDWRGQVVHFNTFEHGRGCLYSSSDGTGASIAISPDYFLRGGYSLEMLGGSDSGMYAKVQGIIGTSPTDRVGLAVAWSGYYTYNYVTFGLLVRKGDTRYIARLQYDPGSYQFKYQDSDAAWQVIATVYLTNYPYAFNFLKLAIDTDAGTYLRAMLNDTEYDLSAYAMDTDALGFSQAVEVEVVVYSTAGKNYGIYLDRYIVTVNEPS